MNGENAMQNSVSLKFTRPAAAVAVLAAAITVLLLLSLHALSPEFDPSWRVVSEYANGKFGWVLSLMFAAWAMSSWALALALWPQVKTRAGKVGLYLLAVSGTGEAMASAFNINHPLHDVAGLLGVPPAAIAASLISVSLCRAEPWGRVRRQLLWTSNLIWASLVSLVLSIVLLVVTFHHSRVQPGPHITQLPPGVIGLDGWADRLFILCSCAWLMATARAAMRGESAEPRTRAVLMEGAA
jgi:hypothetical protein